AGRGGRGRGAPRLSAARARIPRARRAVLPRQGDQLLPRGDGHARGDVRPESAQGAPAIMNFLSPLALLLSTLSVPLLLLYFLKVRRRQLTVSSLLLWDPSLRARVVAPFTRKHDQVGSAIRSLGPRDVPNRLGEGIRTARALVGQDPRAEIHVFTDGAHPEALQAQGDDVRLRWVGVGRRSNNVG